ncbi:Hpt domain-containing protein [Panacagrimonas sp.]|uniref:Hpt domain-containing protein n=1 Tax=Panacagrimonas sp. TaxID=2480088 RepID=UPI003B528B21
MNRNAHSLPSSIRGVSAGLHWVRKELDQNLQLASQLIQQHAEAPQGAAALHKAISHLQEVRGASVLIQAYGVALLAEEMKQTAQDLAAGRVHEPDPAYAAVVGACLQAGDYLDLLQQGQQDSALILQPIVNELRLSRGKSLLTEDDLFVAQFRVLGLVLPRRTPLRDEANLQAEAQRLSPVFSASLLSWFKEQDTAQALSRIGRICEVLADLSRERPMYQLWRTAAACVEALLSRTLDETLELKRQFGRAGQLLKIVGESGEAPALRQMSDVSMRLLFYAGRSAGAGPRVTELRQGLQLETWLPPVETVQACRARLRGANTGLLVRVAEELRADLAEVRDSIDIALRAGAGADELQATADRLKRVADTLLVLGLSAESQALAQPVETLHEAGDAGVSQTAAWMEFATAVLQVDLSLEGALYRQLQSSTAADDGTGKLAVADLRDGMSALYRESLVNLARIKTYIESYLKREDVFGLPEAARLLDEVAAGFRMLALDRAEELTLRVQQFLQSPGFTAVRSDTVVAARFADAIAAIEYYLEFRRDGSPAAADVLDQLDLLAQRLGQATEPAAEAASEPTADAAPEPTLADAAASDAASAADAGATADTDYAETLEELSILDYDAAARRSVAAEEPVLPPETPEFHLLGEPMPEPPAAEVVPTPEAQPQSASEPEPAIFEGALAEETDDALRSLSDAAHDIGTSPAEATVAIMASEPEVDPEIRDIFIEEASEVLQTLQRALPRWLRQPDERELLSTIRRSFHTLKGSGRMVGAQDIGEFSWALESLLNRCLDRTVELSAPVMDTVRDAVELLPAMVNAFSARQAQPAAAPRLAAQARQLAGSAVAGDNNEMIAVFRGDAQQRLQMVARWVKDQEGLAGEYSIPEPVVRAFHTLRGAALAVDARAVGELAGSLETYLEQLHRGRGTLSASGMALVAEACTVLDKWVARAGEPGATGVDARPWLERVEALRGGDGAVAPSEDEDAQLAEIFTFEALDLVQKFETDLHAWSKAPASTGFARSLKATVHTLKGAAGMAHCAPIAAVAQALNLRLGTMIDGQAPGPAFFTGMAEVVEALYSQLDAYRDGSLDGDGTVWVDKVMNIDGSPRLATPTALIFPTPAAPKPETVDFDSAEHDAELREVFLQEAEELVRELESDSAAVGAKPQDPQRLGPWLRNLHTLKGSARVAGVESIAELAHRIESATEAVAAGSDPAAALRFREQARLGSEGLRDLLELARGRESVDVAALIARFDALGETAIPDATLRETAESAFEAGTHAGGVDAEAPLDWTLEDFAPAQDSATGTLQELPPDAQPDAASQPEMQASGADATDDTGDAAAEQVDRELFAIFAPEAEELLESLQQALHAWREIPGDADPSRVMQRDLHTFKGGARMAGLMQLGDAAHELETHLEALERDGAHLQLEAVQSVSLQLDQLHKLYDEAVRDTGLSQAEVAAAVAPLPSQVPAPPPPVDSPVAADATRDDEPTLAAWDPQLFWNPGRDEAAAAEARREAVRVPVERLDAMLNQAGEISIFRARLEEKNAALTTSLAEMAQTITRVREQLRLMDIETEAQIAARGFARGPSEADGADGHRYDAQFDPLEMDRYSRMQELSRSLAESVSDMGSLYASLDTSVSEAEVLLQQQGRINNDVQQGLMGTLMVPFSRQVQRLARVVRQTAEQNGKLARAEFEGADSELDRNVLERMTAPLEHLLRNCVVHGIETPEARRAAGKADEGVVTVTLRREGSQLSVEVRDDGRGLDFDAIRAQAVRRGLMRSDAQVSNEDLARFVFAAGFSTAQTLTQDAGRGIGMDVVASEVKQLGGTVDIASEAGRGVRFIVRLPLMLAVSQALVVQVGEELFAIPLGSVEGISRVPRETLPAMLKDGGEALAYGDREYQLRRLGDLVGLPVPARIDARSVPAILMRVGDGLDAAGRRVAVVADRLLGNREIVTKAAGPILGSVSGVSGATILADGRVMLIVDVPALIQESTRRRLGNEAAVAPAAVEDARRLIMVVDDSITIRRVTERLLTRKGYRVITAKDGLDAMAMLQTETPDAMLLDIEMPRADGFEVAAFVRNTARIKRLPIIMITSRSGDKHREHARSLGVDRYLIKPYQEDQLIEELRVLLAAQPAMA